MRLSVVLNTARPDFSYIGDRMRDVHLFEPTVRSLGVQEERIHELIIVDGVADEARRDALDRFAAQYLPGVGVKWMQPVSPLYPDFQTPCAAKNTGLRTATGDAVWFVDDGMEAPPHATRVIREYVERGMWPSALCHYYEDGEPAVTTAERAGSARSFEQPRAPAADLFGPRRGVRDSRYGVMDKYWHKALTERDVGGDWWRSYTAAPVEHLLAVGGWDETLDAVKGLDDADLGLRMERRWGRRLAVDLRLWVVENRAGGYDSRAARIVSVNPKCNYALIQNSKHQRRSSWGKLPASEVDSMAERVCSQCSNRTVCVGEHLRAKWTPPAPTADDAAAFAAWRRAYVDEDK